MKHLLLLIAFVSGAAFAGKPGASPEPQKGMVSAKILNNKLVIHIWQLDCNPITAKIEAHPTEFGSGAGTGGKTNGHKYQLLFNSSERLCPQHYQPRQVSVEVALPDGSQIGAPHKVGDVITLEAYAGATTLTYTVRKPQPNAEVAMNYVPIVDPPGVPPKKALPAPNPTNGEAPAGR